MFLTSAIITSGVVIAGGKALYEEKRKREKPWTVYAERMAQRQGLKAPASSRGLRQNSMLRRGASAILESKATLKKLKDNAPQVPLLGSLSRVREQQLKEMNHHRSNDERLSDVEKKVQRDFAVASVALGLSSAGALLYAPLSLVSVLPLSYVARHIFQDAYHSLFKERRIKASVADSIMLIGSITTGYYFAASLGGWLYFIARKLVIKTEDHSRKSLINVFHQQPRFVWVQKQEGEVQIPFDSLSIGDIVVIHAGQTIAVDGTIVNGQATIDQRILTGESQPAEKGIGDQVFASTIVLSGQIGVKVEKEGSETVAVQIGEILSRTTDFKTSIQLRGEEMADKLALPILLLAALALPILGPAGTVVVLNANVVYQVRILTPIGTLNFLNLASQNGILIKDGRILELLNQVDTIVFDKTGTLTLNQPTVSKVYTLGDISENELLSVAAAAESKQSHPIAKAIQKEAENRGLSWPDLDSAKYEIGYGLKVRINDQVIRVGSARFMEMEGIAIPAEIRVLQESGHKDGNSLVCVAWDDTLSGGIELQATIRPEAKRIISSLRQRDMSMSIISGDHEKPTQKLAQQLGIEHYFAETLPKNKAQIIEQLQKEGKFVCFIGDGINDSIALKQANVSISLRGASSAATDTAQIILIDESLNELIQVFDVAKAFDANMKNMLLVTLGPGAAIISGAFFLHLALVPAIALINLGLLVGIGNSMLPLFTARKALPPAH